MRTCRIASFLIFIFVGVSAFAQMDRGSFSSDYKGPKTNLLKEGESVAVLSERGVQDEEFDSRRVYSMAVGQFSAGHLGLYTYEHKVDYDLGAATPMIGAQIGYYPFLWNGLWGFQGGVNYGYLEQASEVKTALHIIQSDLLLMYRGEWNHRSWFKPVIGVGGAVMAVLQRGPDEYNTSQARGTGVGLLGVGFNLSRLFKMNSPLDWELLAQYKRFMGPTKASADWNGSLISIGASLAL